MTIVELVTRTEGCGIYDGKSAGEIVEGVARHGKIKDYGKLIKYLIEHKHWSPLEHVHFTFRIETARDISAQMMRHKSFHWQELSQRYDRIQEFMPVELRLQADNNRQSSSTSIGVIESDGKIVPAIDRVEEEPIMVADEEQLMAMIRLGESLRETQQAYQKCIEVGIARECARRGLPMCAKTIVHMTGNLRDFLAYLNVRCEEGTQKEHREVAMMIGNLLQTEFPELRELGWREGGFM